MGDKVQGGGHQRLAILSSVESFLTHGTIRSKMLHKR